ncbi:histidine phosphatase family protein [Leucobacter sp. wl10]|uniref:histidine phosphatase family protein n=1 Tax=Leucobacter sp. wl10 TaxID=2304677 RepID=UPI000E5C0C72|nr:histidine phosphatase family protein [Leucobacter sp. wl10]RGE20306.1 histidine phosphatase family protein [Leucobacter sp. wl10]
MSRSHPRTLALVRHGETDWNLAGRIQGRTEVPLNTTGRAQAAATAALLRGAGRWHGLVSSPMLRAIETAEILSESLELGSPVIDEALWERDFGLAEGLAVEEAHARWPGLEVPGAESLEALAERSSNAVLRLLDEAPGSVVVAHGALIRSGLTRITGRPAPRIVNGEIWIVRRDADQAEPRAHRFSAAGAAASVGAAPL